MKNGSASYLAVSPAGRPALATAPVTMITAVSSAARPSASITPPRTPRPPAGSSRCRAVCHGVSPSASPVSRSSPGRLSSTVRVVMISGGSTSSARQNADSSRHVVAAGANSRRSAKISMKPNSPITIDGTPASRSTARPSQRFARGAAKQARYTPQPTPGSSAIAIVSASSDSVPAAAGQMPSQTGKRPNMACSGGASPKNSSSPSVGPPRAHKRHSMAPTDAGTISAAPHERTSSARLLMRISPFVP